MSIRRLICLLGLLSIGCRQPPENSQIVEQTVKVITFEGEKKAVYISE